MDLLAQKNSRYIAIKTIFRLFCVDRVAPLTYASVPPYPLGLEARLWAGRKTEFIPSFHA